MMKRTMIMSINPRIKNDKISDYLGTDDSIEALEKTVNNGQTRLAMDVIVDLLSEITERLISLEQSLNTPKQQDQVVSDPVVANMTNNKTKTKEIIADTVEEEKK